MDMFKKSLCIYAYIRSYLKNNMYSLLKTVEQLSPNNLM